MWEFAHGDDQRDVQVARRAKSVSNETTFEEDTTDLVVLREKLEALARRVAERLHRRRLAGRTIVLKLTYRNFQHASRRTTLGAPTSDDRVIADEAVRLLGRSEAGTRPVRLVGVGVSGFDAGAADAPPQLGFFSS